MTPPCLATLIAVSLGGTCGGRIEELRAPVLLPVEAPHDLAHDGGDGSLWLTTALSGRVVRLTRDLEVAETFESPFADTGRRELTGIAYWPEHDTLLVAQPVLEEVREVSKRVEPTGFSIDLSSVDRPLNIIPRPYVKGMAFDPSGDGGRGSLWVVEAILTAVYEFSLEGGILRSFCHPDDRDGCPGLGAAAHAAGIELVRERWRTVALDVIGGRSRRDALVRVDLDGEPLGFRIPLAEVGGRPAGIALLMFLFLSGDPPPPPFPYPGFDPTPDALTCAP